MVTLLGPRDELLRTMERAVPAGRASTCAATSSRVRARAPRSRSSSGCIDELLDIIEGGQPLNRDAVERSIPMLRAQTVERPADVLTMNIVSNRGRTIRPKTLGQKRYVDAIDEHTIVFGIGPAGTGKTYLAMAKAVAALQAKQVNRIILTRPAVEAGERLGFLPGTLNDKIDPYLRPLYDALHDMVDPESIPRLHGRRHHRGRAAGLHARPHAERRVHHPRRGPEHHPEQMKMFLTRLGFGSKMVVTGDVTQVDLPGGTTSGLQVVRDILDRRRRHALRRADRRRRRAAPARRRHRRRLRRAGTRPRATRPDHRRPRRDGRRREHRRPQRDRVPRSTSSSWSPAPATSWTQMRVHPQADLCLRLVDEPAMETLHVQWMDLPGPTDVMSFPMDELRPGREGSRPAGGRARRHRALPERRRAAGPRRRATRPRRSCCCSRRTASCTCSATTTRSRTRRRRCSSCSASCCSPSSPPAAARAPDRAAARP